MSNLPIRIIRHPNGTWAAIGAIPLGASVFTIREIQDERPFKQQFIRRFATLVAPQLRDARNSTGCISGAPGSQEAYARVFSNVIATGRKAAQAFADKKVREALLQKIAATITKAANLAEQFVKQSKVAGSVDRSKLASTAHQVVLRVSKDDSTALITVGDLLRRTQSNHDDKSRVLLAEIINQAAIIPVAAARLRSLFARMGATNIVAILDRQVAVHQSRAAMTAQGTAR